MRKVTVIFLTSLTCILVMAAGCTGSSGIASVTASAASDSWSGTWDTVGSTTIAIRTLGVLTLSRSGSSVTGTFSNNDTGKGTISGTVAGNQLTGTWTVDYLKESDNGSFAFVQSDDKKSFTGKWVSASDTANTLSTSTEYWDGVRR